MTDYPIYLEDGITFLAQRVTQVKPFIIHENINLDNISDHFDKWTLTHLGSSFKLYDFKTKEKALRVARKLRDSEIEWEILERNGNEMTDKARQYFSENSQKIKDIIIEACND